MPYLYRDTITIDHTKVGSGGVTNFPMLFSGTYAQLATVANGGQVTNANGYDIIFTSDALGLTVLNYERELYTAATGKVVFWVQVPSLSSSSDTVIYIWYGNSLISTDQSNATATWDSNFTAVMHLGDGATYTDGVIGKDSTSNANNVGISGGGGSASSGLVYGAYTTNGTSLLVDGTTTGMPTGAGPVTLEMWALLGSNTTTLGGIGSSAGTGQAFTLYKTSSTVVQDQNNSANGPSATIGNSGSVWKYVVAVMPSGQTNTNQQLIYVDGVVAGPSGTSNTLNITGTEFTIGAFPVSRNQGCPGTYDEVRISKIDRNQAWITTTYNSVFSPSTFYTFGALIDIELAPGDTQVSNWNDAVTYSNFIAIAPSDSQAANWGDFATTFQVVLLTISDSQVANWNDSTTAIPGLVTSASDSQAGNWSDTFAYLFGTSIDIGDDNSPYWNDTFSIRVTASAGDQVLTDSLTLSDALTLKFILGLAVFDRFTLADDRNLAFPMFTTFGDTLALLDFLGLIRDQSNLNADSFTISDSAVVGLYPTLLEPDPDDAFLMTDDVVAALGCAYSDTSSLTYFRRYLNDV